MPTQRVGGTQVNAPPASPRQRSAPTADGKLAATPSQRSSSNATGDVWYVKYEDSTGRMRTSKMTREQILQGLKSDKLTLKTRLARSSKDEFIPVGQIPVFEAEAKKAVTRVAAARRETNMANAYAKIEKQYNRQKWWRLLGRFRDGTLGIVGLVIWLVVALTVVGGGGFFLLVALKSYAVKEGWIPQ